MTYSLRPAARTEAKPLIGLHAKSGAGKTYSALLLARGFCGPNGRICMIETESGRGEAFSDPVEYPELTGPDPSSNYDVISLRESFSPQAYGEAITAAEQAGIDALIIDSASHEWEGAGGVLSMAAENQAAGKKGVQVWQQPKMQHQRHFMLRFMQTPIPLVVLCMRSKYPMKEVPKRGGGKEWVRSDDLEPKQADDILFEMFVHGWISQGDHVFHLTKSTAKGLEPVFGGNRPISLDTGRQLAEWAKGNAPEQAGAQPSQTADPLTEAKAIAERGSVAFRDWWTGRTKSQNEPLRQHLDDLKKITSEADARLASEGTDDDPFDDTAGSGPETTTESPATSSAGVAEGGGPGDRPSEGEDGTPVASAA